MKRFERTTVMIFAALLALAITAACKTSGTAVTTRGQVFRVSIDGPTDLSEGETKEIVVSVANRGVSTLKNVVFDVEMPDELVVLSEVHGRGMDLSQPTTGTGTHLYSYSVGDVNVGETSTAKFHVRAAFGAVERSGDIRATAYNRDLPGDKLVETKYVKLRR